MVGRIAARNSLHDVAADLVLVSGKRRHQIGKRAPAAVRGRRGTKQCDLPGVGIPPGALDMQAVKAEAEPDLDVAGHPHDRALVLPPVRGAGVPPHREVLIPGVYVRKVVEQVDHWLPHLFLALTPYPLPRLQ